MVRKDCRYTSEHEWVLSGESGLITVGITDFAAESLGDIVYVDLPAVGTALRQTEPFGSIEAVKTVADLFSPIDGEVVEINQAVQDDPGLVNRAPHGDGWLIRARAENPAQIAGLLTPEAYEDLVRGLEGA